MAVFLSPIGNDSPWMGSNGLPLNGGQLFTYLVNSTTPAATYTDSTGLTQNANPIVLNSSGYPPNEIWLTGGVVYKFIAKDANNVTVGPPRDNISGINDASISIDQWLASGLVPTYISATQFTVPGDQTTQLHVGRRLKFLVTAGTVYGVITVSAFTTLTTVTVAMDLSQVLDSGLSAISYGILTATNISIPRFVQAGTGITVTYDTSGRPVITSSVVSPITAPNDIVNGSFAVNQRVTPPTTDNACFVDLWRLMLGAATAATITQDTADVPVGAGYALKLTVGAANNNKFGVFHPMENANILKYRGNVASILVPLKATAALTNIKIGIVQWTSTADAISATPISAWGASGVNPTLAANWSFANTPVSLAVTTAWADYTIINVSISASANNLGVLIWQDGTSSTTATDIMRVGGKVTMCPGAIAPNAIIAKYSEEFANCQRYRFQTFPPGVAPVQNVGSVAGALAANVAFNGGSWGEIAWPVRMLGTPTIVTYNPSVANANWRDVLNSADRTWVAPNDVNERHLSIGATGGAIGANTCIHMTATAATFQP